MVLLLFNIQAARVKKKICEANNFLRRVNFILKFFQKELASLTGVEKQFSGNPEA